MRTGRWLVLALVLAACGDGADPPGPRSLQELERMAFLPPVDRRVRYLGDGRLPVRYAPERATLIDRFETTRDDWLAYMDAPPDRPELASEAAAWSGDRGSWPVFLDWEEARELAARRSMRLATAAEWIYAAVGPRAHWYPWGDGDQEGVANTLDLGLHRPAAVGTFEAGRSPFGCYDMLGNVWEWVDERVPSPSDPPDRTPRGPTPLDPRVSALGGSYLFRSAPLFGSRSEGAAHGTIFLALTLDPRTLSPDLGMRCAADAQTWLVEKAGEWEGVEGAPERVRAVGRRWGPEAAVFLRSLAAREGVPPAIGWLAEGASRARP